MCIFKITCVKEIFIWILTVIMQYFLQIEISEHGRFEICLPSVSVYLETHVIMLELRRKHVKKRQNLTKKPEIVSYKLQFYIVSKKLTTLSIFQYFYPFFLSDTSSFFAKVLKERKVNIFQFLAISQNV